MSPRFSASEDGGTKLFINEYSGLVLGYAGRLESIVDHLFGGGDLGSLRSGQRPFQPNIFVWNEPRWSKGKMYSGWSNPIVIERSP